MRTLTFDQYEFDTPSAEETLELAIASKRYVCSLNDFLPRVVTGIVVTGSAIPFYKLSQRVNVGSYLSRFAGIEIPQHSDWPVVVLNNSWDDLDLVLESPREFIRYHWWTTA